MSKLIAITILCALLFFTACAPVFIPVRPVPHHRPRAIWVPDHHHHHTKPWGWRHRHW